jgi:uncharacterized protein (TIGR02266 family)
MADSKPGTARERRGHFRGKPRPGRRVEVTYQPEGDGASPPVRAVTKNIGVGGAFVSTPDPLPPGTPLRLTLVVPQATQPIEVRAEVRWIIDGKHDEPERDYGMGVKFSALDVEQLMLLNDYFASLTTTDLVEHGSD